MIRRRVLLGTVAAGLAGCSDADREPAETTETVTPAPVPDDETRTGIGDDGQLVVVELVDTHVATVVERGATVGVEYDLHGDDGRYELVRIVWKTDGDGTLSYRYYELNPPPLETFFGIWYDGTEAVVRAHPGGGQPYFVTEEPLLPSRRRQTDVDRLGAVLRAFDPELRHENPDYRLSATGVAAPEELPSEMTPADGRGELSGRIAEGRYVERLSARFEGRIDGNSATGEYAVATTRVAETTVDRPTREGTREWLRRLRDESPISDQGPSRSTEATKSNHKTSNGL